MLVDMRAKDGGKGGVMHVFSLLTNRTDGDLRGKKRDEVTRGFEV